MTFPLKRLVRDFTSHLPETSVSSAFRAPVPAWCARAVAGC